MPKALEPNIRYPICLESDEKYPPAERPVCWVHSLTIRKQNELSELVDSWTERPGLTVQGFYELAIPFFMEHVAGWENMRHRETGEPLEFSEENVRAWFSYQPFMPPAAP